LLLSVTCETVSFETRCSYIFAGDLVLIRKEEVVYDRLKLKGVVQCKRIWRKLSENFKATIPSTNYDKSETA
jgi:hypothetical protein